jgi:hypothetical protein
MDVEVFSYVTGPHCPSVVVHHLVCSGHAICKRVMKELEQLADDGVARLQSLPRVGSWLLSSSHDASTSGPGRIGSVTNNSMFPTEWEDQSVHPRRGRRREDKERPQKGV